jgi:hypothetical protein
MLPGNKTILARVIASVTIFVVIVLSGIYLQAGFSSPSRNITGDAQLVRFMTPFLRGARGHVAVALIKPGGSSMVSGEGILVRNLRSVV